MSRLEKSNSFCARDAASGRMCSAPGVQPVWSCSCCSAVSSGETWQRIDWRLVRFSPASPKRARRTAGCAPRALRPRAIVGSLVKAAGVRTAWGYGMAPGHTPPTPLGRDLKGYIHVSSRTPSRVFLHSPHTPNNSHTMVLLNKNLSLTHHPLVSSLVSRGNSWKSAGLGPKSARMEHQTPSSFPGNFRKRKDDQSAGPGDSKCEMVPYQPRKKMELA